MDAFESYMQPILAKEGRGQLTNDPRDSGGVTIWGITEAMARAAGYTEAMAVMTMPEALAIYRLYFWEQPAFDKIAALFPELGVYMLDIGINFGTTWPGRFVQRALNVLNNQASLWPDLVVDGMCGAMTRAALAAYRKARGQEGDGVLLQMMQAQASVRYIEIAEGKPSQEAFEYGWQRARAFAPTVSA